MASVGALAREYLLNEAQKAYIEQRQEAIEEALAPLGDHIGYYQEKQYLDPESGRVMKIGRGYAGKLHIKWDESIPNIDTVVIPGDAATDAPSDTDAGHPDIEADRAALYKELDNATA